MNSMSSGKKAPVFISVYVVRPRWPTDCRHHHHYHHHHYQHIHQHVRGGYNRKAELLQYCQQLRAAARHEQASPAPKTKSNLTSDKVEKQQGGFLKKLFSTVRKHN